MIQWALITGASGGIGKALAEVFAAQGISLILVARRGEVLEKLAAELRSSHGIEVKTYVFDLTDSGAPQKLYDITTYENLAVEYLVNNAGFGDRADTIDAEPKRLIGMMRLNNEALVLLSQLYGRSMAARKSGHIVNLASTAAFIPGPGMAVYFASKAFVLSFSQALAQELQHLGVQVTAVCPGPTETNFAHAARADKTKNFSGRLPSADTIAKFAYKSMRRGELVAIWGLGNRFMARFAALAPRRWLARNIQKLQ